MAAIVPKNPGRIFLRRLYDAHKQEGGKTKNETKAPVLVRFIYPSVANSFPLITCFIDTQQAAAVRG